MTSFYARLNQRYGTPTPPALRKQSIRKRLQQPSPTRAVASLTADFAAAIPGVAAAPKTQMSVAIIGGGFAGLMAGSLLAPSFKVTVFEARDRVGGRVWTQVNEHGNRAIENGGELIGYNHPTWLSLAKKYDLGLTILTTEEAFAALNLDQPLSLGGKSLTDKQAERIYDEMKQAFRSIIADSRKMTNPNKPWTMPNAERFDAMSVADWIGRQRCSSRTKTAMAVEFANTNGAPVSQQSYLGLLSAVRGGAWHGKPDDYFTQSETMKCERGNQMLAEKLADEIGRDRVRTSTPITDVKIGDGFVDVTPSDEPAIKFDYVVLAVPPSLWAGAAPDDIRIDPPIPPQYRMSMGIAVKYLSELNSRFWFHNGLSPSGSSKAIGVTWDGTDNQLQLQGQTVELSVFSGGPAAETAINFPSPVDRRSFYQAELEKLYPGYSGEVVGDPRFVCWPRDGWTKAGYSCPAPGEVTRIGPFLHRSYRKRLFFAGEHCCPAFYGYMEGALQSGAAAAAAIRKSANVRHSLAPA